MITRLAIKWITWRLRKDKGLWLSYHANIAVSFIDEYKRAVKRMEEGIEPFDIYTVANNAATYFMKLWTRE